MLPGVDLYHAHIEQAAILSNKLTQEQKDELEEIANNLARKGRGLLAADESVGTIGKRLEAAGKNLSQVRPEDPWASSWSHLDNLYLLPSCFHLPTTSITGLTNDEETRRAYREVLLSHPNIGDYLRWDTTIALLPLRFLHISRPIPIFILHTIAFLLHIPTNLPTAHHNSGAILFSETLGQKTKDGKPFPELLSEKGVLPGIKVDLGLDPLDFSRKETHTKVSWLLCQSVS